MSEVSILSGQSANKYKPSVKGSEELSTEGDVAEYGNECVAHDSAVAAAQCGDELVGLHDGRGKTTTAGRVAFGFRL